MNHRLFEDMLLSDEYLDAGVSKQLEEHLRACPACQELSQVWQGIQHELRSSAILSPAPGFSQRWREKLAMDQLKVHQRHAVWLFLFYFAGAVLFLIPFVLWAFPINNSTVLSWCVYLYQLPAFFKYLEGISTMIVSIARTLGTLIPPTMWIALLVSFLGMNFIWIAAFRQLSAQPRIA